ncbi:MAG TPA: Ig-like domain repeat protein [Methanosphaera sp.]|nr:Ig-like domain repeat protein [Methanosphaera sp.]HII08244.1 Ig-like domain repeat protein [Methanosphaera sp.]HIJ15056.1 Ig-like domain repeat protein [Methanosphaera sp.]
MNNRYKRIYLFILVLLILLTGTAIVSATQDVLQDEYDGISNENVIKDNITFSNNQNEELNEVNNEKLNKSYQTESKSAVSSDNPSQISLNTTVENKTVTLVYDTGKEVVITENITTVNGKPDVTKLGIDYAYADENGVYTILGSEIRRVMKLDSYCQQVYGFVPKYTFFRQEGSNVKYIISREKWNVIAKSLNAYHVKQGYTAVDTPYSVTVNLANQKYYYPVYYDAQEWINGQQYTCGPTAMSMISQALNCYSSERRLAGIYETTARDGTDEYKIINYSPNVQMKLTDIADTKDAVKNALINGKMVFWHISGHYMCIIAYNSVKDLFLCLNPSGPSHNINAVQWATWTQVRNTDRALKDHGFMQVTPYRDLTTAEKNIAKFYYYNMGGKYTTPNNLEYPNTVNKYTVVVSTPSKVATTTNQTVLHIKTGVTIASQPATTGKVEIYLNSKIISTQNLKNGVVNLDYTLPAYADKNIKVQAKYINPVNVSSKYVQNEFTKSSIGKTFRDATILDNLEYLMVTDVTGKKGDVVTFKATISDSAGKAVNNGNVVFKLNGNTIKKDGKSVKTAVKNGIAQYQYAIGAFSAKDYKITAVFGNTTTRLESHATLTIVKLDTKITGVKVTKNSNVMNIKAQVVDEKGAKVVRDTKITIKVNGKTLVDKVKVQNGTINMDVKLADSKKNEYNITIIAGENGLYKKSTLNYKYSNITQKTQIKITDFKKTLSSNVYRITAKVVDNTGKSVTGTLKASLKINGKTILNKVSLQNGIIDMKVDLSKYAKGTHNLTIVVGESTNYRGISFVSTLVKS